MEEAAVRARCPPCACGALFCSERCRRASMKRGHSLLCPGLQNSPAAAAWRRFRAHARDAELPELELAAALLAAMLTRLARAGPGGGGGAEAVAAAVALGFVQEPVGVVLRRDAAGPEAAAATLRQVQTACRLLRGAMLLSCERAAVPARLVRRFARMAGRNSFGSLVGLAFLNQVAVVVPSPAGGAPSLDATGLSWLVCMMNHSCAPNASVAFGGAPNAPATARIVALREVAAGEEIVHSYVDCRRSKRVRAEGLAIYGIRCQCARCGRV